MLLKCLLSIFVIAIISSFLGMICGIISSINEINNEKNLGLKINERIKILLELLSSKKFMKEFFFAPYAKSKVYNMIEDKTLNWRK